MIYFAIFSQIPPKKINTPHLRFIPLNILKTPTCHLFQNFENPPAPTPRKKGVEEQGKVPAMYIAKWFS